MNQFDYDLFVIGGGSGGVRAARMWATEGHKVAIAEDKHWGGTCVNLGCVPKKLFVYAAHYAHDFEDATHYGWEVGRPKFNWQTLIQNKNKEIERLNGIYLSMLGNAGVELFDGTAKVVGKHEVQINAKVVTAKRILIAVGGKPFVPGFEGSEHVMCSDDAFYLEELPASMVVVGGGYIALEFACIFNSLGVKVDLVYRGEMFLRGFDDDLRKKIASEMTKQGIALHFNQNIESICVDDEGRKVAQLVGSDEVISAESYFYATGRVPRTEGLWNESVDIATKANGSIVVNDNFQTSVDSIFALGDVVGRMSLTPVATAEAMALLQYFRTGSMNALDYNLIASAVFTLPNLAVVGITEQQANKQNIAINVFDADFKYLKHTLTGREERVYMKLIEDANTGQVVGVHMMGPDVGEIMQGVAIAVQSGATKEMFDKTIGIHPTIAEELVTMRTARS